MRVITRPLQPLAGSNIKRRIPMDVRALNDVVAKESAFIDDLTAEIGKVIVGQSYMIERVMVGLLAGGHVLLEGVPGLLR